MDTYVNFEEASSRLKLSKPELRAALAALGGRVELLFDGELGIDQGTFEYEWGDFAAIFPDSDRLTSYMDNGEIEPDGCVHMIPGFFVEPKEIIRGSDRWEDCRASLYNRPEMEEADHLAVELVGEWVRVVCLTDVEAVAKCRAEVTHRLDALDAMPPSKREQAAAKGAEAKVSDTLRRIVRALLIDKGGTIEPYKLGGALEILLDSAGFSGPESKTIGKHIKEALELPAD